MEKVKELSKEELIQILDRQARFDWKSVLLMVLYFAMLAGLFYFLENHEHPYGGYIHLSTLYSFASFFVITLVIDTTQMRDHKKKLDALTELLRRSNII